MSQDEQQPERMNRPVLNGLVALLAVAIAVGLIVSGVALVGVKYLGLGDGGTGPRVAGEGQSAIIPKPQRTTDPGPQVTLATDETDSDDDFTEETEPTESESAAEGEITLSAGQTSVANFGQIDLTGVYPGGEGAVLQVQRLQDGAWVDFDATIPVSGETFATYVQTGVSGMNKFRVLDPETNVASNVVRVTVG